MSLKTLLQGAKELIKAGKPKTSPATGKQQGLLTYDKAASQKSGIELAEQELKNPPVVLKKTKPLHMGDDTSPAFGSSTYDWIMRKGKGNYTADEWLDHLTSTRDVKIDIFGRPATQKIRAAKRFKYDTGPFRGKEVVIGKEELFDSNLAIFNEAGDLTGGLLYAAKKFGLKLNANDLGAMIKLNPLNRIKPVEFGGEIKGIEKFKQAIKAGGETLESIDKRYSQEGVLGLVDDLDEAIFQLKGVADASGGRQALDAFNRKMIQAKANAMLKPNDKILLNKVQGEINQLASTVRPRQTFYKGETNYTLQGGKNYSETVFHLDEPIPTNSTDLLSGGHFSQTGLKNQVYHVRFDTRFTPEGKKVFLVHEIQSDINQDIAKELPRALQFAGTKRINRFQQDLETKLLMQTRDRFIKDLDDAVKSQDSARVDIASKNLREMTNKIKNLAEQKEFDYLPLIEAEAYSDHAIKYLVQKAAREGVDYVAVAPFDKLSFRQLYAAGNERVYGYASGKGIGKQGRAVVPEIMKKLGNLYGSKAGPVKISLSDPKLPYKKVSKDTFKYESANTGNKKPISENHPFKGKIIQSIYHEDAVKNPKKGYKLILENDPRLYFDAFSIKVTPLMRQTQKTYRSKGGLVVDIFKPVRYNQVWL